MTFTRDAEADTNGTYLITDVGDLRPGLIEGLFGAPDGNAVVEPERGYDGQEYTFASSEGEVATLYTRWGSWRIGARIPRVGIAFRGWLDMQLGAAKEVR